MVRRGLTSAQIAAELGLSRRTVDQYILDACGRLGARSRAQAVAEALKRGEITQDDEASDQAWSFAPDRSEKASSGPRQTSRLAGGQGC